MFFCCDFNPNIFMVAFICIILVAVRPHVQRWLQRWIAFSKLPGPSYVQQIRLVSKLLFKTEVLDLAAVILPFLNPYVKQYPMIAFGGGSMSFVLLCNAEAVKVLLSSKVQLDKGSIYKEIKAAFGDGLVASDGAKWHQHRRLLTPYFHVKMLENYLVVMNEQANTLVRLLEEKSKEANGTAFDVCPYISRYTLDIVCETLLGQRRNFQTENDNEYCTAVETVERNVLKRFLVPWLWCDAIYWFTPISRQERRATDIVHGFSNEIVKIAIGHTAQSKTPDPDGPKRQLSVDALEKKNRLTMLDMLVETSVTNSCSGSETLTEKDIRDEVTTFLFAGSATSFVTVSWALYHIGRNPAVQQKIVDELNLVYGDDDRNNTSDDLNNLKYMECVIKETLRMHPPGPMIGRRLTEETNICGCTIPAVTDVYISIYLLHRDPSPFPDPEIFDPDRFLPENSQSRGPFAFIPFSAGVRNCIGKKFAMMETKVALSAILRRFKVNEVKLDEISNIVGIFVVHPLNGVWVQLEMRKI